MEVVMRGFMRARRWAAVSVVALVPVVAGAVVAPGSAAAAGVGAEPAVSQDGSGSRRQQALVAELQQAGGGAVAVQRRPETGAVSLVGGSPAAPLTTERTSDHGAAARGFVDRYGPLFGVDEAGESLVEVRRTSSQAGGTAVRFEQRYAGVPVFGAGVSVQVGADGRVLSSLADTLPASATDTSPAVPATAAADAAVGTLPGGAVTAGPDLAVYDPVLLGAPGAPGARLVWRVEVTAVPAREVVLVDAHTGVVVLHVDQAPTAKDRKVCDNRSDPALSSTWCGQTTLARAEGDPPTGKAEVDRNYELLGATYDFYWGRFGRDSLDGLGAPLLSTVDYCRPGWCPFSNAYWIGGQTVFGAGWGSADDVVAHELTHGVTQFTANLAYYGQSGAINESLSDTMGEIFDLVTNTAWGDDTAAARWLVSEDAVPGGIRNMKDPTAFGDPDRMSSPLYADTNLDNGAVHTNSGVGNKAAFLITDGGSFNGQSVAGLGLEKAARLYYLVDAAMLLPSSDYADLGAALGQACTNLVGTAGFTAADCTNVNRAVTATEMLRPPHGATYHPLTPTRILDSRPPPEQVGPYSTPWGPGEARLVQAVGTAGVPMDAAALVVNVTVTGATATSHLSVYPAGRWTDASNLNFTAGQTIPNLVTVPIGNDSIGEGQTSDGWITVFNSSGFVHVIVDVVGYYGDDAGGVELTAVTPFRLLDSREGNGTAPAPWTGGETRDVQVTGVTGSGVPATGVAAVVLNVTAVTPSAESFLSVWPTGLGRPLVSNLNFPAHRTIPNLVVVKVGAGGKVSVYDNSGAVDVVADVVGYYSARPSGGRFTGVTPARVLDTRPPPEQIGPYASPWGPGQTRTVAVTGVGGVAPLGVSAVVLNVTAVNPTADSHLTVWNTGVAMPTASNLNFRAGDVIPNLVVAPVGADGTISIFNNSGTVDVLADVVGFFS
ncbi:MAG: M4 family metallopeptidase [Acidimicrobiales bacterium]